MINTSNFKFDVSLTTESFKEKPSSDDVRKLRFKRTTTTLGEFCDAITQGYGYVGIFNAPETFTMHDKTSTNFQYSYFVSVDIDHSQLEMDDVVSGMRFKPTIAYTSCNNGKDGDCRFRFVYLFDKAITSQEEYCNTVFSVLYANGIGVGEIDGKSFEVQQYFNGNGTGEIELLTNNIIYCKEDLKNYYIDYYCIKNKIKKGYKENVNEDKVYKNIHYDSNDTFEFVNKDFEEDYDRLSIKNILEKYVSVFPNLERTQLPDADEDQMTIPLTDDFVSITRNWKNNRIVRIKDGESRRYKLFINGVLRRLINPEITYDNLVYNLLYELYHYYSNVEAKNIIGKAEIKAIAANAMKANLDDYQYLKGDDREYEVNQAYCIKHNQSKIAVSNTARKLKRWEKIGELYDFLMTDDENVALMRENGIPITKSTLIRWRVANGITKYKKERVALQKSTKCTKNVIKTQVADFQAFAKRQNNTIGQYKYSVKNCENT